MYNGNDTCHMKFPRVDCDKHTIQNNQLQTCHVEHQLTLVRSRYRNEPNRRRQHFLQSLRSKYAKMAKDPEADLFCFYHDFNFRHGRKNLGDEFPGADFTFCCLYPRNLASQKGY
jgi:hypothetical protein